MKKIIFIAAFLLFIHTAPAQEGFSLGAHALYGHSGIISQNAYGFTELDPKFNSSFGGGLVAMYHITSMLGLTAEFNFMDMEEGGRARLQILQPGVK